MRVIRYEGEKERGKAVRGRSGERAGEQVKEDRGNREANLQDRGLTSFREELWGAEEKLDFFSL